MIVEIVSFEMPEGFSDADLIADARGTVAQWQANPDLIRKHFLKGENGNAAGLYIWPNRAAAQKAHDAAWKERFRARTGRTPDIAYFDLFLEIDNKAGTVEEFAIG